MAKRLYTNASSMQTNIQKYRDMVFSYARQLRDPRMVGLLLFLIVVLLIAWSGVKAIETNYGLQKQIAQLEQQNAVQRLSNENMQLRNEYYNTPQYLELAARKDFGLAAKGETVLIVPKHVALAQTVDLPKPAPSQARQKEANKPAWRRNFDAWMDFFLNRERTAPS